MAMSDRDQLAEYLGQVPAHHDVTSWPGHGYTCEWCGPLDSTDAVWHWSDKQAAEARNYLAGEVETLAGGTGSWDDAITAAAALIRGRE